MASSKRKSPRQARAMGSRAEALLSKQLTDIGYEVRRTHLSAFPDIVAWNEHRFLLIEVKARSDEKEVNKAVSFFRGSAKALKVVHPDTILLCYVRSNDTWRSFEWNGSGTIEVDSLVAGKDNDE
jgi:predicted transcriptional regulator